MQRIRRKPEFLQLLSSSPVKSGPLVSPDVGCNPAALTFKDMASRAWVTELVYNSFVPNTLCARDYGSLHTASSLSHFLIHNSSHESSMGQVEFVADLGASTSGDSSAL